MLATSGGNQPLPDRGPCASAMILSELVAGLIAFSRKGPEVLSIHCVTVARVVRRLDRRLPCVVARQRCPGSLSIASRTERALGPGSSAIARNCRAQHDRHRAVFPQRKAQPWIDWFTLLLSRVRAAAARDNLRPSGYRGLSKVRRNASTS